MIDLKDKRVLVTGPNSMVGRAVTSSLKNRGAIIWSIFHEDIDCWMERGHRMEQNVSG